MFDDTPPPDEGGTWQGKAERLLTDLHARSQRMSQLVDELTAALEREKRPHLHLVPAQDGDNGKHE